MNGFEYLLGALVCVAALIFILYLLGSGPLP